MPDRIEGQIWISRDEPNVLKYFANNTEYWTVAATTYLASSNIHKGMLVAPTEGTGGDESVRPAEWPKDALRTVGIALNTAAQNTEVRILNYGYVMLTEAEIESCFVTGSDTYALSALTGLTYYSNFGDVVDGGEGNDWEDTGATKNGRGAPIYWFSGRTLKTGAEAYSWVDPSTHKGKLTFATPCGYKPTDAVIPWGDDSFNVTYKKLPTIGSVVNYEYDSSTKKITELTMHVNFSQFNNKLQFEYPAIDLKEYAAPDGNVDIMRHGLFANFGYPHVEASMWGYSTDSVDPATSESKEAMHVWPGYDNYITGDRRTEVEVASDTGFFYKILGEVSYNS